MFFIIIANKPTDTLLQNILGSNGYKTGLIAMLTKLLKRMIIKSILFVHYLGPDINAMLLIDYQIISNQLI